MSFEIIAIKTKYSFSTSTSDITEIKLSGGVIETIEDAVRYIDTGMEYFYTTSYYTKAIVETVHPYNGKPYIRTKANNTTQDNLLSLPRF